MNKRIQELLAQCTQESIDGPFANPYVDQEKFAELIVRECCEVAHCNFHVDGVTLGSIMKEHFGVEE